MKGNERLECTDENQSDLLRNPVSVCNGHTEFDSENLGAFGVYHDVFSVFSMVFPSSFFNLSKTLLRWVNKLK